jgi:ABC-type transport system involved in multi-copper enzyme maturation permease subunit
VRVVIALFGPIFAKESYETARAGRYHLFRIIYVTALLVSFWLVWLISTALSRGRFSTLNEVAEAGEAIFHAISTVQIGAVLFLVPIFLCGSVVGEREDKTMDALVLSELTDREIVVGKLTSRVTGLFILILGSAPALSFLALFGGVEPPAIARILAATMLMIIYVAAHSMYFSVTSPSSRAALIRTYSLLAVWLLGVPAIAPPLLSPVGAVNRTAALLALVNPSAVFLVAYDPFLFEAMTAKFSLWFFPALFVLPIAWSLFIVQRAVYRLRAPATYFLKTLRQIDILQPLLRRLRWEIRLERRRLRDELWRRRPVSNPLWQRARRWRVYDPRGRLGFLQWAIWPVGYGLFLLANMSSLSAAVFFLGTAWLGIGLLAAILAATSVVSERRRGFFELILATTMSPRRIVNGFALALWHHLRRSYWLAWIVGVLFVVAGQPDPFQLICSSITATLFCGVILFLGLGCSLTARNMASAMVPTVAFPVFIFALPFLTFLPVDQFEVVFCGAVALCIPLLQAWARRRRSSLAIGCLFLAVHIALVAPTYLLVWSGWPETYQESPMRTVTPVLLILDPIRQPAASWPTGLPNPMTVYFCYWLSLAANILWARRWLINNFDRLLDRPESRASRMH